MNKEVLILLGVTRWFPSAIQDPRKIWRDEYSKIAAAQKLGVKPETGYDFAAIGSLIRAAISDEDEQVRFAAINSLANAGSSDVVVSTLYAMTFDENNWIREHAFGLLKSESADLFCEAALHLQHDEDEDLKAWATNVLQGEDEEKVSDTITDGREPDC